MSGREEIEQKSLLPISQAGAICLRTGDRLGESEIVLISSRTNGSWGIPKGNIEPGETYRQTAEREAFEEAGVKGCALGPAVGRFSYQKAGRLQLYSVCVYLLSVQRVAAFFPEIGKRQIKWVPLTVAAYEVASCELSQIISSVITPLPY